MILPTRVARIAQCAILVCFAFLAQAGEAAAGDSYRGRVESCAKVLMEHGTDRYGEKHAPILVSILDVQSRECPQNPAALDEAWRVTRRERRNPAGANLVMDQPVLDTLWRLSELTGDESYAAFATRASAYTMKHLVDEKGLFWWGWHRHYDVFRDVMTGHAGNHHEIHATHRVTWDRLWQIDPAAVRREIEAIWRWHVIDKKTGEINRHADGQRGCDFGMSGAAFVRAFAFLHRATKEKVWLDRARLLAEYYWERRDPKTDLFAERPNAGRDRFDGGHFVTAITGPHCLALLDASELSGETVFRDYAVAYLKAYARYGVDESTDSFWGTLRLDGKPEPGPRLVDGYAKYEPRGHLDLWEPYVLGYQFPVYTAQAYAKAYEVTRDEELLATAKRFARWIGRQLPARGCMEESWYREYAREYATKGTYAGKYGRTVSFFLQLHALTGEAAYLKQARAVADDAIAKLSANGLFRGHPAKPYYEATDGVGFLLRALLQLDQVLCEPQKKPGDVSRVDLDNW